MRRRKRISDIKNIGFVSTRFAGTDGVSLETADHNYSIARRFYSYANLRRKLRFILTDFFGEE